MTTDRAVRLLSELVMDLNVRIADVRQQKGMRDSERAMTITAIKEQQDALGVAIEFMKTGVRTK